MKFFTNKKFLFKLIASLCICLTLFNFGITPKVQASGELVSAVGGKLLDPICDLLVTLGDGVMEIIQKSIMGNGASIILDTTAGQIWRAIVTFVKLAVSVIVGGILAGAILTAIAAIPGVGAILAIGISSTVIKVGSVALAYWGIGSVADAATEAISVLPENVVLPTYFIGPEEIFSGKILLLDPNIFNPKELYVEFEDGGTMLASQWNEESKAGNTSQKVKKYFYEKDGEKITTSVNNSAAELKDIIAKWYYVIRNIALIGLMLVLIYVGIRMLLTSIASEKAKYKQMLGDWIIALCLIFLMQYIMVFANSFIESIINILSGLSEDQGYVVGIDEKNSEKLIDILNDEYPELASKVVHGNEIRWPTNLTGVARIEAQKHDGAADYVGYTLCYIVLILYTVFFIFTYVKRLLYLLFLTVIAPFVALTYPLDKIRDGQAQAFNMWMKEYIFNLLIQPFHLLLYTLFVSMAFDFAGDNIIYSLVVLGFMIPAEKFLRSMFGFDKAKSPGLLAGPAGAALTISAVQSLAKFAGKGSGGKKIDGGTSNNKIQESKNDFLNRANDSGKTESALINDLKNEGNKENTKTENNQIPIANERLLEDNNDEENKINVFGDESLNQPELEAGQNEYKYDGEDKDIFQTEQAKDLELENQINDIDDKAEDEIDIGKTKEDEIPKPTAREYMKAMGKGLVSDYKDNMARLKANNNKGWKDGAIQGIKSTAKTAGKFTMGTAGAAIGVSAGIAAGSPGDAFKYGATGVYAGSAIGEGVTNRTDKMIDNTVERAKQRHETTLKTHYGPKAYKQIQNAKKDQEFKEDVDIRNMFAEKLGLTEKADIDFAMHEAIKYRQYGVTDNKVIVNAMKYNKNDRKNWASKTNIAAAQLSSTSIQKKDFKTTMDTLKQRGLAADQIEDIGNRITFINESIYNKKK